MKLRKSTCERLLVHTQTTIGFSLILYYFYSHPLKRLGCELRSWPHPWTHIYDGTWAYCEASLMKELNTSHKLKKTNQYWSAM